MISTQDCHIYRSVPLIRPPILYTTSRLKWGGGLIFEDAISLDYKPPPPQKRFYASAMYAIRTLPKLMFAFHYQLTMATTFRIESTVRGHHVYKAAWSPYIGEELPVQREVNNIHDDFAVAVLKNGNTVGHVPREISRVCWYFLHKSGSEMTCIVNGDRRRSEVDGKGLVVPCVYIFRGKQKHLDRLINLFAKLAA